MRESQYTCWNQYLHRIQSANIATVRTRNLLDSKKNFARAYNHATSYAHAHRVDQGILHTVCPQVSPDVQFMSIDKVFRTTCEPGI